VRSGGKNADGGAILALKKPHPGVSLGGDGKKEFHVCIIGKKLRRFSRKKRFFWYPKRSVMYQPFGGA
jgi:hypothetical protein